MDLLFKILKILSLFLVVYLWNRFIIKNMLRGLVRFHKKNNAKNIDKQPIKFLIQKENKIYNFAAGFYWVGIVLFAMLILLNE